MVVFFCGQFAGAAPHTNIKHQTSNIKHQTSNIKSAHTSRQAVRCGARLVCDSVSEKKTNTPGRRERRRKKLVSSRICANPTSRAFGQHGARMWGTHVGNAPLVLLEPQKTKAAARKVGIQGTSAETQVFLVLSAHRGGPRAPSRSLAFLRAPSRSLALPRAPSRSLGRNRRQAVISRRLRRSLPPAAASRRQPPPGAFRAT